jgi:hypothetical protein
LTKRWGSIAAALAVGVAGTGIATTQAWADNASTVGCITVYVSYDNLGGDQRRLNWVESRNACGAWSGHFDTDGYNGPDSNPVRSFRVNLGGKVVSATGFCYPGVAWRNDGGGHYTDLGNTCTPVF